MNLRGGARRILIVVVLLWLPLPTCWVVRDWEQYDPFDRHPEIREIGREFIRDHPVMPDIRAEDERDAADYLRRQLATASQSSVTYGEITFPLRSEPTAAEIAEVADDIAFHRAVDEHWDLSLQAWWKRHDRSWKTIGIFMLLPIIAAVVFYFVGLPILMQTGSWIEGGFKKSD